jgi:hypothetical protein
MFLAKLPQCPLSQLEIPATFLGDLSGIVETVSYPLPVIGVHPPDRREKIPPGANGHLDPKGDSSSQEVGVRALDAQWNPLRHRNQLGSTTHQIGKNLGSNSGLPQEAAGETDHLPETP